MKDLGEVDVFLGIKSSKIDEGIEFQDIKGIRYIWSYTGDNTL